MTTSTRSASSGSTTIFQARRRCRAVTTHLPSSTSGRRLDASSSICRTSSSVNSRSTMRLRTWLLPELAQCRQLCVDLIESRAHGTEQAFAHLGRRNAPCGAGQQPKPEPLFESPDRVAERRLRNAELRCGPGEAPLLRYSEEGKEVIDVAAGIHESTSWVHASSTT